MLRGSYPRGQAILDREDAPKSIKTSILCWRYDGLNGGIRCLRPYGVLLGWAEKPP